MSLPEDEKSFLVMFSCFFFSYVSGSSKTRDLQRLLKTTFYGTILAKRQKKKTWIWSMPSSKAFTLHYLLATWLFLLTLTCIAQTFKCNALTRPAPRKSLL